MYSLTDLLDHMRSSAPPTQPSNAPSAGALPVCDRFNWLDQLPEAVLVSLDGCIQYANAHACALFSVKAEDGVLHSVPLTELLPGASGSTAARIAYRINGERFHAAVKSQPTTFNGRCAWLHVVRNIDHEYSVEQRLQRNQNALLQLSGRLMETQERERRHIARELHDEIGQCLSAIRVQFAKLQRRLQTPELLHLIESASGLTERTLGRVRSLSLLLHPPQLETLGLRAALRWHLKEQERLHGWHIDFVEGDLGNEVHPDVAIAAYRIVQESLSNAFQHGGATHVTVKLTAGHQAMTLEVIDDGCGFIPENIFASERPSLGLIGMTERARLLHGELSVTSAPGKGTHISAVFPWIDGALAS